MGVSYYKKMWQPFVTVACDVTLGTRDAGGGGDCMFHSIAAVMGQGHTAHGLREMAAQGVTPELAPYILQDMAAQLPETLQTLMTKSNKSCNNNAFSPECAWNASNGNPEEMANIIKDAVSRMGNYMWGDATIAALLERQLGVNIVLLANVNVKNPDIVYNEWIKRTCIKYRAQLSGKSRGDVIKFMQQHGLTRERAAKHTVQQHLGYRYPLGTVHAMNQIKSDKDMPNMTIKDYRHDLPTVVILNISNVHWVPVCAMTTPITTIFLPNTKERTYIDKLLSNSYYEICAKN